MAMRIDRGEHLSWEESIDRQSRTTKQHQVVSSIVQVLHQWSEEDIIGRRQRSVGAIKEEAPSAASQYEHIFEIYYDYYTIHYTIV